MRPNDYRLPNVLVAIFSLAVVMPALARGDDRYEGDGWANEAPPPPAVGYDAGGPGDSSVDVSVDLATPGAAVSFSTFHDGLAPYGEWVTVSGYGRVWRPARVAAGWRPYYYGRWEWTDEGWLWVSDEPWGWAAYHYGRWAQDPYYGWVWIPGYQWAPAWVTWRYSPAYIGWAPLGPGFSVYVTSYPAVYSWWTFVPCHRFVGIPIHSVAYTGGYVRGIYGATRPAPPRVAMGGVHGPAWGGPARPFIEQRIGRPVAPVRVQPVASPRMIGTVHQPGLVQVYRPEARMPVARGAPTPAGGRPQPGPAAVGAPARPSPGPSALVGGATGAGGAVAAPGGSVARPARPSQAPAGAPATPSPAYGQPQGHAGQRSGMVAPGSQGAGPVHTARPAPSAAPPPAARGGSVSMQAPQQQFQPPRPAAAPQQQFQQPRPPPVPQQQLQQARPPHAPSAPAPSGPAPSRAPPAGAFAPTRPSTSAPALAVRSGGHGGGAVHRR